MVDEGFEDISIIEEAEKKIIVLGLNGAGKSSFLYHLSMSEGARYTSGNTNGFDVVSLDAKKRTTLNFWEVGGSESVRMYWSQFVQDTDAVIYIVDSTDDHKLVASILEFHKLVAIENIQRIPVFILANKQDLENAASAENIAEAFGINELLKHNKITVLPLKVPQNVFETDQSVLTVKDAVIKACCCA